MTFLYQKNIVCKRGTRHSHRYVSFTRYATALCAPGSSQQYGAVACTSHTRVPARQKQANLCLSYKMKEQFFCAWDKGTPRPKCKRLYLVAIVAIGLVCDVSSALKGSPPCSSKFRLYNKTFGLKTQTERFLLFA